MRCPNCGKEIKSSDQKFCRYCGAELKNNPKTSQLQNPTSRSTKNKNYAKRCFSVALVSFVCAIISIIIGIILIYFVNSSIYLVIDEANTWFMWIDSQPFPIISTNYALDEGTELIAYVFGLFFIIISLVGLALGIIGIKIRNKAVLKDPNNRLIKIGGYLSIFGIILNIIGIVIGFVLFFMPFYVIRLNYPGAKLFNP